MSVSLTYSYSSVRGNTQELIALVPCLNLASIHHLLLPRLRRTPIYPYAVPKILFYSCEIEYGAPFIETTFFPQCMATDGHLDLVIDMTTGVGLVVSRKLTAVTNYLTSKFAGPFAQTRATCPATFAPVHHRHCASVSPPAWPTSQDRADIADAQRLGRFTRYRGPL